ncbi:MAG: glucose-6-phosphate isomerase [Rickettsiales bacterium]|nr:glucose-6-phosphate isomerase [Rickettsiales bacterium]
MTFSQRYFNFGDKEKKLKELKYCASKKKLLKKITNVSFGFIEDLYKKNFDIIFSASKTLKKFDNILFLGTGGSSLGGKTLVSLVGNIFYNSTKPRIYFIENIDENSILQLLKKINLASTGIVVTSKSGETIETISQYFFVENFYQKKKISLKKRVFIITENKNSILKEIQENRGYFFLEHPSLVGGRYSVFSVVGLLPAALVGFDIKEFCNGAKSFLKKVQNEKNFDYFFFSALTIFNLNKKRINMSVIMPYSDSLNYLSFWYRQLWAESIGKKRKGITPINALGTVDQHSQLQLYLDGPKDKIFTIIGRKLNKNLSYLDCSISKKKKYSVMHAKSLDQLLYAEMKATIKSLKNQKLPVRTILIDSINEKSIGSLMMFFFIETILCCDLFNLNPFNQPAVEEGKKLAKIYLKK